jgi:glycerol-3-phosphate acyltransferase PlsY
MPAQALLWTVIGFFSGSLMFSYWIGRYALGRDIREVGDGNPGMTNVLRAGGKGPAALAFALDVLKAAIPVSIAYWLVGIRDVWLIPVALAPVVGHAYSPWLRFQGGKAVAASFGLWMGLTIFVVPMLGGLLLGLAYALVTTSGWAMAWMLAVLTAFIAFTYADPLFMAIILLNAALLLWKYRADLRQPPALRPWLVDRLWPNSSSSSPPPPSAS